MGKAQWVYGCCGRGTDKGVCIVADVSCDVNIS